MNVKPIRTKKDYDKAMKRIYEIISHNPKPGTPEYDELKILSNLAWPFEEKHYPVDLPDPIKAIKYIMEEKGLIQKDIIKYFNGNKGLASAVLNGKRSMSKKIIKSLHKGLGIPYEILMI